MSSSSTMTRPQLQALAKQHGVKANMKNSEIEAALLGLGVSLAPTKKTGLSVRDDNVVSEVDQVNNAESKPKAKAATTKKRTGKQVAEEDQENAGVPPSVPVVAVEPKAQEIAAVEDKKVEVVEVPLALRRPRRSGSLAAGTTSSENEAPMKETSSRTEEVENDENQQVSTTTAGPVAEIQATMQPTKGKRLSSRYVSERRSHERETLMSEIEKEQEVKVSPAKDQEQTASNEQELPPKSESMEIVPMIPTDQNTITVADAQSSIVTAPAQTPAQVAITMQSSLKSTRMSAAADVVTQVQQVEMTQGTTTTDVSAPLSVAKSVLKEDQSDKPQTPQFLQLGKPRKIVVPDLPPTPPVESVALHSKPTGSQGLPRRMIKRTSPVAEEEPALAVTAVAEPAQENVVEVKAQPAQEAIATTTTTAVEKATIEEEHLTVAISGRVNVPFLPETPANVRQEQAKKLMMDETKLSELRGKVKGALDALGEVHQHLTEQKRLWQQLETVREENKRLRAALKLDD